MTFWHGSGYLRLTIQIRLRIQILLFSSVTFIMATQNYFFLRFFAYYFLKLYIYIISKVTKSERNRETIGSRNQSSYYYFCLMTEGSGTSYYWIRMVQIIRIRTVYLPVTFKFLHMPVFFFLPKITMECKTNFYFLL